MSDLQFKEQTDDTGGHPTSKKDVLPKAPAKIGLKLLDAFTGVNYVNRTNPFMVFSDAGMPVGSSLYTWSYNNAAQFNGLYTGETPPEGIYSFQTVHSEYAGWGESLPPPARRTSWPTPAAI